jgi:type IV pilus assembly protein PilN
MSTKTLNIEVGDRLTKVCFSVPKGRSWQIKRSFMFQTPDNAVADGAITAPDIFAAALTAELKEHGLSDVKSVIFTLTSGKVASREIRLPPVKESRLKGIVTTNAAEYFPIDLSAYHVTYSLLDRVEKGENAGYRVLVMAAPLSLLEGYFKTADNAGLSVRAIDFSGNSQFQALRNLNGHDVTMYVNVDCTSSYVSFIHHGKLLLQRSFTFGGDELIQNYISATGKGSNQYVEALAECSTDLESFLGAGLMSASDVHESLSRLVSSILRSIDYFNSNRWDAQVEKVVLMGPCSRLVGLRELVAQDASLETYYLDELPGAGAFATIAESASFYISCIGSSIAPLDFMPEQFRTDRRSARKPSKATDSLTGGIVICAVCVLAALVLSFISLRGYSDAKTEKAYLESQIAALEYTRSVYDTYIQYKANADELQTLSDSIVSPNDDLRAFVDELEQKMPAEIAVLSAVCTRDGVGMNINVPSYNEVASVLLQLRGFESIGKINVSSINEVVDETGATYVSFSVNCVYKASIAAAEKAAAEKAAAVKAAANAAPATEEG